MKPMNNQEPKRERRERRKNAEFERDANGGYQMQPHSRDAEMGLLGSILIDPLAVLEEALEKGITPEHFYVPAHGRVFELICAMREKHEALDLIVLTQKARDLGELETLGGAAFLTGLFTFTPTAANSSQYIEIIREKFVARQIIRIGNDAARRAYDGTQDPFALLEDVQGSIIEVGQAHERQDNLRQIQDGISESLEDIDAQYGCRGDVRGLATGFPDFDRMTGGLFPGQYFIIAARPSMGKSAVAMNIAEYVACEKKQPVAVFSLEMTYKELCTRLLCARSPLNIKRVRDGLMAERDFDRLTSTALELSKAPVYVDDKAGLTVFEFKARARRAVLKHHVKLIVVDYLQLMKSTSRRAQSDRQQEISEISSAIRESTKELGVPIIAVAQLSRDVDQRKGHRPQLSDLRESGTLEQDAHIVAFMLRPAYYTKDEDDGDGSELKDGEEAVMIIAKQRNGPTGDVNLIFQKEYARFRSKTESLYSNDPTKHQQR